LYGAHGAFHPYGSPSEHTDADVRDANIGLTLVDEWVDLPLLLLLTLDTGAVTILELADTGELAAAQHSPAGA
jgi:hypothetical protein